MSSSVHHAPVDPAGETEVRRLFVLLCGFEIIPKTISTMGRGERFIMSEPISAYLMDTEAGWILFDTGLDEARTDDPLLAQRFFVDRGWAPPPVVLPLHRLRAQLDQIGVGAEQIRHVILSHMHADHTGNLKHFLHARVSVQRAEYEYAFESGRDAGWIREDYDLPGLEWHLTDGDWDVMPGLSMIATPGHTPGHQSALVTLPSGHILVLTADAGDLQENFDEEIEPGASIGEAVSLASIRRLKALAARPGSTLFLGHDPNFIQSIKLAPAYYD